MTDGPTDATPPVDDERADALASVDASEVLIDGDPLGAGGSATDVHAPAADDRASDGDEPATADAAATTDEAAPPQERTIGRLVADALRSAGVRYAFTVPGESFLGLLDALGDAGIRVVATRHEGGAAFMAEAHAQLTGRPAACIGTRAVGAANLAIGIHTARHRAGRRRAWSRRAGPREARGGPGLAGRPAPGGPPH